MAGEVANFNLSNQPNTGIAINGSLGGSINPVQNTATTSNQYLMAPQSGGTSQGSGAYSGGDGSNYASLYAPQIGSIDAQTAALQGQLGTTNQTLSSGLANLQNQYNQQVSAANQNHSNALQDFQTTEQNDNLNHQTAIDNVNTGARTLANSVRQMIGNASGSGSSAYQIAAPDAVARQADLQSQGINNSFGQNMEALTTAKQREDQAYEGPNGLLGQLADKLTQSQNGLKTSLAQTQQQINGQLADLAAQRAAYLGGGVGAAQAAASPYTANISDLTNQINNIASSYQSPFSSITPVSVAAPTLRDYVTGQTSVATDPSGTNSTTGSTYNPALSLFTGNNQQQNQYAF